jgi:hypothetical protein
VRLAATSSVLALIATSASLTGCGQALSATGAHTGNRSAQAAPNRTGTVRLLFAGDATLGPGALPASRASLAEFVQGIRFEAQSADMALTGPGTGPAAARPLALAGFSPVRLSPTARIVRIGSLRVDLLSFGPHEAGARAALTRARRSADVVAVALRGSAPRRLTSALVSWGADVVWGEGSNAQPVRLVRHARGGRSALVAPSLGKLALTGSTGAESHGLLLEVLAGGDGVRAYRIGSTATNAELSFTGWRTPRTDAVALAGQWWTLARRPKVTAPSRLPGLARFPGKVTAAAIGDPVGNGGRQLAVSFRRPFRPTKVDVLIPRRQLLDRHNLTAHIGLYNPHSLRPIWVAGTLLRPVARLTACDGSLALAYSTLNNPKITATGAWRWGGFGFLPIASLPGPGVPACADVDGDGRSDPIILERSSR